MRKDRLDLPEINLISSNKTYRPDSWAVLVPMSVA
jgi:hypothetical protein